ncbi:MAG TPA: RNA polymerase sigma factor SigJ [Natronosporangium sp.]
MSDTIDIDQATEVFAEHRELLFAIAYQLLGSVADTEDVLQETWLSWAAADRDRVDNDRAYLVRIAINQALDRLRRAQRNRETYVGPWLPEPLIADADASEDVLRAESASLAMLVVLETLTPLERAVFVLREAFGYDHNEIATMLGRSPEAVRQLAHRARSHVRARRPRAGVDARLHKAVTERFIAATVSGDVAALMELLAPDVQLWTDTGGAVRAARRVIAGVDKVVRLLVSEKFRPVVADADLRFVTANGEPAVMLYIGDHPYAFGFIDVGEDGLIRGLYGILNPEKLRALAGRSEQSP